MRSDEFIAYLKNAYPSETQWVKMRSDIPLGRDSYGETVYSYKNDKTFVVRHTCVTGTRRTAFIKRLLITLSCLYEKSEANFLILSPKSEYGELLRLQTIDATVPYVRNKADLENALAGVKELVEMHRRENKCLKLFLVLDGLEEIEGCNKNSDLEEFRTFFDVVARQPQVEVISGAELMKSIFSGYPGAFVGVGNCLVTTRESGKADVTYVHEDVSLSQPVAMEYPDVPTIMETLLYLNNLASLGKTAEE